MSLSVTVFIDLEELAPGLQTGPWEGPRIDWEELPASLASEGAAAALSLPIERLHYAEARIYARTESAESSPAAETVREAEAARNVVVVRTKAREHPGECRACELAGTAGCHHCRNMSPDAWVRGSAIDAIASDMFRLTRERAMDVAVLVSAARRLVPVVRFLEGRGIRVVVGGCSPGVGDLSAAASGRLDLNRFVSRCPRPENLRAR